MRCFNKIQSLLKSERANVAAVVAVSITALLGLTGAAVDMGMIYAARGELQNAADAAALAGANTLIAYQGDLVAIAQPSVAETTARNLTEANTTLNDPLTMRSEDLTMGFWDAQVGDFDAARTGPSGDPDDLTALRVKLRRDDLANSPVSTWFASALGIDQVPLSVVSTGHLGYAGSTQEGQVTLPIALLPDAISDGGDGPICDIFLMFHNENNETVQWTTFFTWPTNDPNVKRYVTGQYETPEIKVGDEINIINGNLSQNTFRALRERFEAEGDDLNGDGDADQWRVLLPVATEGDHCQCRGEVVGFAYFVITEVLDAPEKRVEGWLECGLVIPDSQTGGGDYGARATYAKLVN